MMACKYAAAVFLTQIFGNIITTAAIATRSFSYVDEDLVQVPGAVRASQMPHGLQLLQLHQARKSPAAQELVDEDTEADDSAGEEEDSGDEEAEGDGSTGSAEEADNEDSDDKEAEADDSAAPEEAGESQIPHQLVMTAKEASLDQMSQAVQDNVKQMLANSPGVRLRWLSDANCTAYIQQNYDADLIKIFKGEPRGSYRGDICRAAVLAKEGGFYLDLDVQMKVPISKLVDKHTTFASVLASDHTVLNAVVAAAPGNPVLLETLEQIRRWYHHKAGLDHKQWMGPETMLLGLRSVVDKECNGQKISPEAGLQWQCGSQVFRFYEEKELMCLLHANDECPQIRLSSDFTGLKFGIFEPGTHRQLIGWPRFANCTGWGCGAGGWDVRSTGTANKTAS